MAFVSNRTDDRESNSLSDIWTIDLQTGEERKVTNSDGTYMTPSLGQGRRTIGLYRSPRRSNLMVRRHWMTCTSGNWQPQQTSRLLTSLDREPGNSAIADSRSTCRRRACAGLRTGAVCIPWSATPAVYTSTTARLARIRNLAVGGARDIQSFSIASNGAIAFAAGMMDAPTEVFVVAPNGRERRHPGSMTQCWKNWNYRRLRRSAYRPMKGIMSTAGCCGHRDIGLAYVIQPSSRFTAGRTECTGPASFTRCRCWRHAAMSCCSPTLAVRPGMDRRSLPGRWRLGGADYRGRDGRSRLPGDAGLR